MPGFPVPERPGTAATSATPGAAQARARFAVVLGPTSCMAFQRSIHSLTVISPAPEARLAGFAAGNLVLHAPRSRSDSELLEAAAWLHDIGYLPELDHTGLHGLDGARYLRDVQNSDQMLCRLIAHHSCAAIEAEERGLAHIPTREFTPPPQHLADA